MKSYITVLCASLLLLPSALIAQSKVVVIPLGSDETSDETTRVFAQVDNDFGGMFITDSGQIEINSIEVDIPADGFLIITGSAYVNNQENTDIDYILNPRVNGLSITPDGVASFHEALATGEGDQIDLNYVWTHPISAGAQTVSQVLGPRNGIADFFVDFESFNVLYVRTGVVVGKNSGPVSVMSLSKTGKESDNDLNRIDVDGDSPSD
jgi:hypothetical protein